MNPFALTPHQWRNAALLGVLAACAYIGLTFGADLARYRAMVAALAEVESCDTETECWKAWQRLEAAKK